MDVCVLNHSYHLLTITKIHPICGYSYRDSMPCPLAAMRTYPWSLYFQYNKVYFHSGPFPCHFFISCISCFSLQQCFRESSNHLVTCFLLPLLLNLFIFHKGFWQFFVIVCLQLLTVITTIDDLNYPEKTDTYFIVNAPYIFSACWKVCFFFLQFPTYIVNVAIRGSLLSCDDTLAGC